MYLFSSMSINVSIGRHVTTGRHSRGAFKMSSKSDYPMSYIASLFNIDTPTYIGILGKA